MPLTSQSCVGLECPWVRGLSPPCWRQPVPGLQAVKGNHASWCHCIPLHYHDAWVAWVSQHVTLSTHRNGLEAASSPRPATSLLSWQMPCSCSLCPLLGVLTLGFCHSFWPTRLLQPGRQAKRDWHPNPVLQTVFCPVTFPHDCFQLLLDMEEAVWLLSLSIFPTLFPKANCTGREGWRQTVIQKP